MLKIVIKIVNCCFFFSRILHKQALTIQEEDSVLTAQNRVIDNEEGPIAYCKYRQTKINAERESAKKAISETAYKSMIQKFTKTFDSNLKQFMNAIKSSHYDPYIANLLMRLDFNGFYADNLLSHFEGFGGPSYTPSESVNMTSNDNTMY